MLTPPPAPTDQEYDAGLKALDDYKKEREAHKDLNIVANIKSHIVGAEHQVEDLIHGVQHVSHNVAKNIQTKTNEASIRMEKATHIWGFCNYCGGFTRPLLHVLATRTSTTQPYMYYL